jgi:L-2-amino-thiazoline-4-carboxylic acid hydrolase-like protein
MEQISRLFSFDALLFICVLILIFNLVLIKEKEWKTLGIFHIAGMLNLLIEIFLILDHTRIIDSDKIFIANLTVFVISWVDTGLFTSIAFLNINWIYRRAKITRNSLIILNLLYFVGMPIASSDWGIFNEQVLTVRIVDNPLLQNSLQFLGIIIMAIILIVAGYRRLLKLCVLNGIMIGLAFEFRLYIANVRQVSTASVISIILNGSTLAILPILLGVIIAIIVGKIQFTIYGDRPPLPKYVMNLKITLAGVKVLNKELNFRNLLKVVIGLVKLQKKGEPWKNMGEPETLKDKLSRGLIGDAILIYRVLKTLISQEEAERIIKKVVMAAAIKQLYSLVPQLEKAKMLSMSDEERKETLTEIVEKFPNTDWELLNMPKGVYAYRITNCRLVNLVKQVGHPELRFAFCPGDAKYFEDHQRNLDFERPSCIGKDDSYCDFIFKLKDK